MQKQVLPGAARFYNGSAPLFGKTTSGPPPSSTISIGGIVENVDGSNVTAFRYAVRAVVPGPSLPPELWGSTLALLPGQAPCPL